MSPKPFCELTTTHYQTCNHLTTSLLHASTDLPSSPSAEPSNISIPKSILICPQAIYNTSLFPAPEGKALLDTSRCSDVRTHARVNAIYGCPDCEPEYHLRGEDYVVEVRQEGELGIEEDEEKRKSMRIEWCKKVIEEWEERRRDIEITEEAQ